MLLGNKLHMNRIIDHVRADVILHNFMICEPFEDEWIAADKGVDDLEPEATATRSNEPDNHQRKELLYYLSEVEETAIN
jgi:hypothetical protein